VAHIALARGADDFAILHRSNAFRKVKNIVHVTADQENSNALRFHLLDEFAA